MSEIKKIHVFPEFGTKEFNDLAFTYCGGKLKQEVKAITKEEPKHDGKVLTTKEVMEGRSNAYDFIDFDKQEDLEEVTERLYKKGCNISQKTALIYRRIFIDGVKWQAERSYSEEEVKEILLECTCILKLDKLKWFKQFKNK